MKNILVFSSTAQQAYQPNTVITGHKQYLVVPVVMMVEGVHNGSAGPVFHSADELGKSADAWEGVPVTIHHPELNGNFVSVNSEGIMENYAVGYVTYPVMKDNKLTAFVYLDSQRLMALSTETLNAVMSGQIMEVSVGVFTNDIEVEGQWNEETYYRIAKDIVPDHLAILPSEVGACSVTDGCGLRVNLKGGKNDVVIDDKLLKDLTLKGYSAMLITQVEGLQERVDKVRGSLYSKDNDTTQYYIEEIFDAYAVFRLHNRVKDGDYWKTVDVQLLKQTYQINTDGSVEWVGEPVKVVRNVEYVQVNNVNSEKMCEPCKEKVNELIAHASTHFNDSDREWLEALTEDKLDKLIPKVVQVNAVVPTYDEAVKIVQATAKSLDDYMNILPENVKAEVNIGLSTFKEKKSALITSIQANTEKDVWTEDELNAMSIEVLQKLEKSVETKGDFSLNRIQTNTTNASGIEPLMLPIQ